jgi:hypothetical protein
MNCNQLCPINYGSTHQMRFYEHLLELRSLLEDKYKLLAMPFSFRFCLYKYHLSCPTTRAWLPPKILTNQRPTQNRTSSPLEDYSFSTLLTQQWSYRSDTAGKNPECVNVPISNTCTTTDHLCTTVDSSTGWRPDIAEDRSGCYPAAGR